MNDDPHGNRKDGAQPSSQDSAGRLPPPAFPPRARARPSGRPAASPGAEDQAGDDVFPDDAFISPDDPIVRAESRIGGGAFISPDDPFPKRGEIDPDEVVVTGIGDDPHLSREELSLARHGDPHVAGLAELVGRLADGLRDRGEPALRTTPAMSRFETTLRAYCVGYLVAQRERQDA